MAYKTVLVHLNNEPRVTRLMHVAMQLALPTNGHVIGLFVVPRVPFTSSLVPAIGGGVSRQVLATYRQSGDRIEKAFGAATATQPVVAEWRLYEHESAGYVDAVLDHARVADIVVAAQKESDWDYADMFDVPDWLAMESGRPVVIVPTSGDVGAIGQRVLVAWNNSREAARAIYDAMPILKQAREVRVLTIEESGKPQSISELSGHQICSLLSRHGVNCVAEHIPKSVGSEPGELLLDRASLHAASLVVMGCYGRSRLREFILGGATRYVLKNATIPVLLAH